MNYCIVCRGHGRFCQRSMVPYCYTIEELQGNSFLCDACDGTGKTVSVYQLASVHRLIEFCNQTYSGKKEKENE